MGTFYIKHQLPQRSFWTKVCIWVQAAGRILTSLDQNQKLEHNRTKSFWTLYWKTVLSQVIYKAVAQNLLASCARTLLTTSCFPSLFLLTLPSCLGRWLSQQNACLWSLETGVLFWSLSPYKVLSFMVLQILKNGGMRHLLSPLASQSSLNDKCQGNEILLLTGLWHS